MSQIIRAPRPPVHNDSAPWSKFATAGAAWVWKHLVNRTDAYGGYFLKDGTTHTTTRKAADKSGPLSLATLVRHFNAKGPGDVVGLHSTYRDEAGECWSRWLGVDIDRHDEGGDPEANLRFVVALFRLASSLGFCPILTTSDGRGGYHVLVVFDQPVRTRGVFAFGRWLIRDWESHGLAKEPEVFPKQAGIPAGGHGNWMRVFGRNPKRKHWSQVFDGGQWLSGTDAIEFILATVGGGEDLIPAEAKPDPDAPTEDRTRAGGEAIALAVKPKRDKAGDGTTDPGEDFNRRASWESILVGWRFDHESEETGFWARPGKAAGVSATTNHSGADCLYVFTDATAFRQSGSYTKFGAYTVLSHGGDFTAAARTLSQSGYGTFATWIRRDDEWVREIRPNPCPPGVRIAKPGEGPPAEYHRVNGQAVKPPGGGLAVASPGDDHPGDGEEDAILDRWPVIDPHAFHGVAGEIVSTIDPHSEGDRVGTLLQFLVAFGNLIGRSAFFRVGPTVHHFSLFAVLVGATSVGRKGTAWDGAKWILELLDRDWAGDRIQSGLVIGEGLIHHVRDASIERREVKGEVKEVVTDGGVSDKRLLLVETEWSRALKAANKDGCTLSDVVRQAWDSGNLRTLGKIRPSKATGAHISIIGHTTHVDVRKHLTDNDSANGFANRFLWACVRRSKELPDGGDFGSINWTPIHRSLSEIVDHARHCGEMKRGPRTAEIWRDVYPALTAGKPGLLGAVTSRSGPQVLRLACVYALLDGRAVIDPEHLVAALAVWEYCEASARMIFGESHGDPAADKLLAALRATPDGLTRKQITVGVFNGNKKSSDIGRLLSDLLTQGVIHRQVDKSTGGRPAEQWFAGRGAANAK